MDFRTKETLAKYYAFIKERKSAGGTPPCRFCKEILPDEKYSFKYWKILHNNFPYDNIAELHDMLIPKRHFADETEMNADEREELIDIKVRIIPGMQAYDTMIENFKKMRSMEHYHIHLIKLKID